MHREGERERESLLYLSVSFVMQYTSNLTYLNNESFTNVPPELVQDLRRMLNPDELSRPSAMDFTSMPLPEFLALVVFLVICLKFQLIDQNVLVCFCVSGTKSSRSSISRFQWMSTVWWLRVLCSREVPKDFLFLLRGLISRDVFDWLQALPIFEMTRGYAHFVFSITCWLETFYSAPAV